MYYTTFETHPCYHPSSRGAATSINWTSTRNWHSLILCKAGRQPSNTQPPLHIKEEERQENKVTRRHVISMPGSMLISSAALSFSGRVGPNGGYTSINEAIRDAPDGGVIYITKGVYHERVVLDGPSITLQASPEGSQVTIIHQTDRPYESTVHATSGNCLLRGLTIAHRSPSVANNYALFLQGASLTLEGCKITSDTGSGVGLEGGQLTVSRCRIQGCKQHGLALFNSLDGLEGSASVRDTVVSDNGLDGILVRDGARLNAEGVQVIHNMGHGFNLNSGLGSFTDCLSRTNGKGAILLDNAFETQTAQTGISIQ